MFTKLNPVNNQPVLPKYNEWPYDDVISHVTVNQFRSEFSIFQACKYHNLISWHMISIDKLFWMILWWRHQWRLSRPDSTGIKYISNLGIQYNSINLHPIFTKLDMVDNQPVLMNCLNDVIQWHHSWPVSARILCISSLWIL